MAVGLMLRFLELELAVDAVVRLLLGELTTWLGFLGFEHDENGDSDIVDDGQDDNNEGAGWAGWAPTRGWPVTDDPLAASGPGGWGPCLTMDDGPGNLSPPASPVHSGSRRGASGPWEAGIRPPTPFSTPMMAAVEAAVDR
jgi:hypothetical protein